MTLIFISSGDSSSGEKSNFITTAILKIFSYFSGHIPTLSEESTVDFIIRKIAHITEFFILTSTYYYGLEKTGNNKYNFNKKYLISAVLALLYAISDEFHQLFVPSRVGTYKDVLIDSIGIFLCFPVLRLAKNRFFIK